MEIKDSKQFKYTFAGCFIALLTLLSYLIYVAEAAGLLGADEDFSAELRGFNTPSWGFTERNWAPCNDRDLLDFLKCPTLNLTA